MRFADGQRGQFRAACNRLEKLILSRQRSRRRAQHMPQLAGDGFLLRRFDLGDVIRHLARLERVAGRAQAIASALHQADDALPDLATKHFVGRVATQSTKRRRTDMLRDRQSRRHGIRHDVDRVGLRPGQQ